MRFFTNHNLRVMKRVSFFTSYINWPLLQAFLFLGLTSYSLTIQAQTNGPVQPEFTRFESVSTTNMVDLFSGDFSYNIPIVHIPGPNGFDYALSLSYHSGNSPDEDASWVGYGWTLNPGAIIRNKRGFPDDINGGSTTLVNKIPANRTVGLAAKLEVSPETVSLDILKGAEVGLQYTLEYNSYKGLSSKISPFIGYDIGVASLNLSMDDGNFYYSAAVNPAEILSRATSKAKEEDEKSGKAIISKWIQPGSNLKHYSTGINRFGQNTFFLSSRNTAVASYYGSSLKLNVGVGVSTLPVPAGIHLGNITGYYATQYPIEESEEAYFGFLYTNLAGSDDLLDYFTEKNYPFTKKDKYLAIPYSNADFFNLTGEGLEGSFRFFNKNAMHFAPKSQTEETTIEQEGFEALLGGDVDFGVDGVDEQHQELSISEWYAGDEYRASGNEDESYYIKFSSDLSSNMDYGDDGLQRASLESTGGSVQGTRNFDPEISGIEVSANEGRRVSRSAYITWHTNKEMSNNFSGKNSYQRYDRTNDVHVDRSDEMISDGIGEFVAFDKNGTRYVYALPVYSCLEEEIAYSVSTSLTNRERIVYEDISSAERMIGEVRPDPYATTFLLTEITSSDYIDLLLDGPSSDDLGEYVVFEYERAYGSFKKSEALSEESDWYHWRIPYNGLLLDVGELSNKNDNMGSYASGNKEIYYLKTITTKTHKAEFLLDEGTRSDAYDANHDDGLASKDATSMGKNGLRRLEEVKIWAIGQNGAPDELMQTTYFRYDYSLCKNMPNSEPGAGKLTLKKLWSEYALVKPAKVSSYEFIYEYPEDGKYPDEYNGLDDFGGFAPEEQNPEYDIYSVDPWGSYQNNGDAAYESYLTSVSQQQDVTFDPAAYQLKAIKLPSNGEIHIQYEQDNYGFVQDRPAMFMVPLKKIVPGDADMTSGVEGSAGDYYYLDLKAVGIEASQASDRPLLDEIKENLILTYLNPLSEEWLYFKFMYDVMHPLTYTGTDFCNPEYFEGYAKLQSVDVVEDAGSYYISLQFNKGSGSDDLIPRTICKEFYKANLLGKISLETCVDDEFNMVDEAEDVIYALLDAVSEFNLILDAFEDGYEKECAEIEEKWSYIRVPLPVSKKGGGLRVKRLLTWDRGLEAEDTVLYGQEFLYTDADSLSTGVAQNEPSSIGGENALITFLDRSEEYNLAEKLLRGGEKDIQQYRGPIGEGILPGPSVGYAQVISRNIHSGVTNPGFSVTQYYTAKEYPFDGFLDSLKAAAVDNTEILQEKDWISMPLVPITVFMSSLWATQGYRFILNDMHGRLKQQSTYQGNYNSILDLSLSSLSMQQVYEYSEPGETVTVMEEWGKYENLQMGKEMEVVFESRKITDLTLDASIEFDVNALIIAPAPPFIVPAPTFMVYTSEILHSLSTHGTNKIIKYPSILKSVTSFKDGVYTRVENLAFDKYTGDPIITKSYDSYDSLQLGKSSEIHNGNYLTYQVPSSYYYEPMGPKYVSDRMVFASDESLTINKNCSATGSCYLEFYGTDACNAAELFTPGDWVSVSDCNGVEIYFADSLKENFLELEPHPLFANSLTECNAINVEIIRTARTNQLSAGSSSIVTYGGSVDDYRVEYQPGLAARVNLANQLNALLAACKSSGTVQQATLAIPDSLEVDGSCLAGPHTFAVEVSPVPGSSDQALICVPDLSSISAMEISMVSKSVFDLKIPQDLFKRNKPSAARAIFNPDANPNPNPSDSGSTTNNDDDSGKPICQCLTDYRGRITGLEDAIAGIYWLPTDTIRSTTPDGFEFKFTVELGSPKGQFVEINDYSCPPGLPPDRVAFLSNAALVLFDEYYYEPEVNKICFQYCDDATKLDQLIIESDAITYSADELLISNLAHTGSSPYITVTEYIPGVNPFGRVEIELDAGDHFNRVVMFSENLLIDSIQFCMTDTAASVDTVHFESMCYDTIDINGYFKVDSLNGELVYYGEGWCTSTILECLNLCPNLYPTEKLNNVISTSEIIYSSDWTYDDELLEHYYPFKAGESDYHHAQRGIWRPWYNAKYLEDIEGIYDAEVDRVYNAGYFDELVLFNHTYSEANLNSGWIPDNKALLVTPNGNVSQNMNALEIPFSGQYGDLTSLPVFTASNAEYDEVSFSSIESEIDYVANDGSRLVNDVVGGFASVSSEAAHSGTHSLKLASGILRSIQLRPFVFTSHFQEAGLVISLWVKSSDDLSIRFEDKSGTVPSAAFSMIARSGEWMLYEVTIDDFGSLSVGDEFNTKIDFEDALGAFESPVVYVDDIRLQPADAQVNCYVYDSQHRLITSFDDGHFGRYYLYDAEGRLSRQMVETERGMQVVQETFYNTPKQTK